MVLSGLLAMQHERLLLGIAVLLGVSVLLARWAATLPRLPRPPPVAILVPVLFFAFFVVFLLGRGHGDEVTADVIAGALSVYLFWA